MSIRWCVIRRARVCVRATEWHQENGPQCQSVMSHISTIIIVTSHPSPPHMYTIVTYWFFSGHFMIGASVGNIEWKLLKLLCLKNNPYLFHLFLYIANLGNYIFFTKEIVVQFIQFWTLSNSFVLRSCRSSWQLSFFLQRGMSPNWTRTLDNINIFSIDHWKTIFEIRNRELLLSQPRPLELI